MNIRENYEELQDFNDSLACLSDRLKYRTDLADVIEDLRISYMDELFEAEAQVIELDNQEIESEQEAWNLERI